MKVFNPSPSPTVATHVERILVLEHSGVTSPFRLPLFANGTPTLLYISAPGKLGSRDIHHLLLFGQTVFPETLTIGESFTLIAYFLKPFSLFSLFGVAGNELTDSPVDLELLLPAGTAELREKLLHTSEVSQMLKLLDGFLVHLLNREKQDIRSIRHATSIILANPAPESLLKAQKELCMTERTFERLFSKSVGVSPNLFRRISQFNAAFQQLNTRSFDRLTDLAFAHGYADQSHFIRAFKEFTGITPKQYLRYGDTID